MILDVYVTEVIENDDEWVILFALDGIRGGLNVPKTHLASAPVRGTRITIGDTGNKWPGIIDQMPDMVYKCYTVDQGSRMGDVEINESYGVALTQADADWWVENDPRKGDRYFYRTRYHHPVKVIKSPRSSVEEQPGPNGKAEGSSPSEGS